MKATSEQDKRLTNAATRMRITKFVIQRRRVSKAEIEAAIELSHPTVVNTVAKLIQQGVLRESGSYDSTGGRKAKAISVVPDYRYYAGIDVTANHVVYVIIDFQGTVVARLRKDIVYTSDRDYTAQVVAWFNDFVKQNGIPSAKLQDIGVSVPGILSTDRKNMAISHRLVARDRDLGELGKAFGRRTVTFENDANAAVYAERDDIDSNTIYVQLSDTVGGAFLFADGLYVGDNRRAGSFGHIVLHPGGKKCYCGKNGCVDAYLSAERLSEKASSLEDFFAKLENGDRGCAKVFDEYLEDLAALVTNIRLGSDCDVMLGGYVGAFLGPYRAQLVARAKKYDIFDDRLDYIKIGRCGREASATGAALNLRDESLKDL